MRWTGEARTGAPLTGNRRRMRLLVADRQPLVRAALAALLADQGHDIVAEASDTPGMLAALAQWQVDVALIDIDLADNDPTTLLAAMRACRADTAVVLLAPVAGHAAVAASVDAGVAGLALRSESAEALQLCVAAVARGEQSIDRAVMAHVVERARAAKDEAHLTRRERDVAQLVATGQRNRAIAGTLGISEGTVKMHLHNVYAKLGLESRTQLAMDERLRVRG